MKLKLAVVPMLARKRRMTVRKMRMTVRKRRMTAREKWITEMKWWKVIKRRNAWMTNHGRSTQPCMMEGRGI
jgi:hypothetical protein